VSFRRLADEIGSRPMRGLVNVPEQGHRPKSRSFDYNHRRDEDLSRVFFSDQSLF